MLPNVSTGYPLLPGKFPRVTHPSATELGLQAALAPFDLHVLSLPLAFVLSQDQTLKPRESDIIQTL